MTAAPRARRTFLEELSSGASKERDEQSQVAQFVPQGFAGNAQLAGGLLLIAVRILQNARFGGIWPEIAAW